MNKNEEAPLKKPNVQPQILLANGVLKHYQPHLEVTRKQLNELNEKQSTLINQIHEENLKISDIQHSDELHQMMTTVKVYQTKLTNIKKDMKYLHEKSIKLKKRAAKLQMLKEKEQLLKAQKQLDLKKEEDLIAKTSTTKIE